jgi:hypothetical protein
MKRAYKGIGMFVFRLLEILKEMDLFAIQNRI